MIRARDTGRLLRPAGLRVAARTTTEALKRAWAWRSATPRSTAGRTDGYATVLVPMLVALTSIAAVAVIDVTAYLAAASRAQSLADAAALAAVTPAHSRDAWRSPEAEAYRVVDAGDGRLEACDCRDFTEYARVSVSVDVHGLVIPELGASRVTADADAILTRAGNAARRGAGP